MKNKQMHADEIALNRVSERIIGCAFTVLNSLGAGFLEKVYENALDMSCVRPALRSCSNTAWSSDTMALMSENTPWIFLVEDPGGAR